MSRNGPAPTGNLHGRGNEDLRQAFTTTDPRQIFYRRTVSSSGSLSSGRHAGERAVDGHGRATPGRSHYGWGVSSEDYPSVPSTQGVGSRYPPETRPVPGTQRASSRADSVQDEELGVFTPEENAAMRGEVILRGDGYRLLDAHHHPSLSQTAHSSIAPVSAAADVSEYILCSGPQAQRSRRIRAQTPPQNSELSEDTSSISSTEPQPSTTDATPDSPASSIFSPPSPPPRVSSDIVAHNPFLAANQFYFEPGNVGREDFDDGEESAALDRDDGFKAGARRLSLAMREWWEWGKELEKFEKWGISFEGVGADDGEGGDEE